jgi:hypothetical protein
MNGVANFHIHSISDDIFRSKYRELEASDPLLLLEDAILVVTDTCFSKKKYSRQVAQALSSKYPDII